MEGGEWSNPKFLSELDSVWLKMIKLKTFITEKESTYPPPPDAGGVGGIQSNRRVRDTPSPLSKIGPVTCALVI